MKGAHGSREGKRVEFWLPAPLSWAQGLLTPPWWNAQQGLTFVKGSQFMEPAVSAWGISRNFSSCLSPLRGDELREGFS